MKEESVPAYTVGTKQIRVGSLIRTRISSSSGPVYRGKEAHGERGLFRVLAILVKGKRVHVEAVGYETGRAITLYLAGPKYRSPVPYTVVKPYKFTITTEEHVAKAKKRKKAAAPPGTAARRKPSAAAGGDDAAG